MYTGPPPPQAQTTIVFRCGTLLPHAAAELTAGTIIRVPGMGTQAARHMLTLPAWYRQDVSVARLMGQTVLSQPVDVSSDRVQCVHTSHGDHLVHGPSPVRGFQLWMIRSALESEMRFAASVRQAAELMCQT